MAVNQHIWPWTSQPQEAAQFRADLVDQLGIYAGFINPQVAWRSGAAYSPSGIAPSPTQAGLAISNTTGTAVATYPFSGSPESSELTVIMHAVRYGAQPDSGFGTALYAPKLSGSQDPFDWFIKDSGERIRLNTTSNDASGQSWETTENWPVGIWQTAAFTWRSGSHPDLYRGGRKLSRSVTSDTAPSGVLKPGGVLSINLGALRLNGAVAAAIICSKALRDDQIAQYALDFQSLLQLLAPQSIWVPVSAGGGGSTVDLDATATAQSTATADLSNGVTLTAAALTVATATAGLSLSIPLAGTAQAVATGNAALSLTVNLAGGALAQAIATAAMELAKPLAAAAQGEATGTADLSTSGTTTLAADAQAVASAGATLSLTVNLAADAIAVASASAELGGAATLAAAAIAQAQASAAMSVGKPLVGSGQAVASAGATITLQVPLGAAALAQAAGTAALSLTVNLAASAFGQASASAAFAGTVDLASAGQAIASATAALTVVGGTIFTAESRTRLGSATARAGAGRIGGDRSRTLSGRLG